MLICFPLPYAETVHFSSPYLLQFPKLYHASSLPLAKGLLVTAW